MGKGDGGALLDKALTSLGESYAEGSNVGWSPPKDLDAEYVEYLSASVDRLNQLIADGVVEVTEDGSIQPVFGALEE